MSYLYIPEQQDDPQLRQDYFRYSTAGNLDVLGRTFEDTLYYNPAAALTRMGEYYFAKDSGKKLSRDDWAGSKYYREGIEIGDDGIYEGAAALLAERHDERAKRSLVLNRSKGGFALGAAQFGVSLVGSMLDPLNVGTAFIPVVNAGRFASLVGRYGKTGARLVSGAIDGAAGAAMVEPIVLTAAAVEQDKDYTYFDSFMNVVFGSVLGGGLHAIGGRISDAVSSSRPDTRQVLTRTAVGQLAEGRRVNVHPVTEADANLRSSGIVERQIEPDTVGVGAGPDAGPVIRGTGRGLPNVLRPLRKKPKSLLQFIKEEGGIKTDDPNAGDVRATLDKAGFQVFRKTGKSLDDLALAAQEAGYIKGHWDSYNDRATINDLLDAIEADAYSNRRLFSETDEQAIKYLEAEDLLERANRAGVDPSNMTDDEFFAALSEADSLAEADFKRAVDMDGLTEEQFYRLREESYESLDDYPELADMRQRMEDAEMEAREFDDPELELIMRQNEELMADVRHLDEEGLLPRELMDDINDADRLIEKAENSYEPAVKAAAACVARAA